MPEASLVPEFLKDFALKRNFAVHDCVYGSINLGRSFPIEQSCGAVTEYGPVPHTHQDRPRSHTRLPSVVSGLLGQGHHASQPFEGACPGHQNGNINLPSIPELENLPLVFGSIFVAHYDEFERLLHAGFPPLRGTPGRASVDGRESACLIARAPPGQVAGRVPGVPRDGGVPGFLTGSGGAAMDMSRGHRCLPPVRVQFLSMEPDGAQAGLIEYSRVKETVTESRPHRTA